MTHNNTYPEQLDAHTIVDGVQTRRWHALVIQEVLHLAQVLLRHVQLAQLHVEPRHFQHIATVRVLADLVSPSHLRFLQCT